MCQKHFISVVTAEFSFGWFDCRLSQSTDKNKAQHYADGTTWSDFNFEFHFNNDFTFK